VLYVIFYLFNESCDHQLGYDEAASGEESLPSLLCVITGILIISNIFKFDVRIQLTLLLTCMHMLLMCKHCTATVATVYAKMLLHTL